MMRHKPRDSLSAAGRLTIVVVVTIVALAILVFLLIRPVKPNLDAGPRFGEPAGDTSHR